MRGSRLIALLVLPAMLFRCTVVGYGIGSGIDISMPGIEATEWASASLKEGQEIVIQSKDGGFISGEYLEIRRIPVAYYGHLFKRYASHLFSEKQGFLPGDSVDCILPGKSTRSGMFLYLEPDSLAIRENPEAEPQAIAFRDLRSLHTSQGNAFSGHEIQSWVQADSLPVISLIVFRTPLRTQYIPLNRIDLAGREKNPADWGRITGVTIGMVLDILLLFL